ncbi:nitroreductase [Rhodoligotrophos appendicifer]|uniref:nitroreductase n=1 Tax=Rhodoligotrophos appendicifer TaxID=987056 RepID=UPI00117D6B4A|nr:nitroreductase [Rhodoligotrophos appendicifer]
MDERRSCRAFKPDPVPRAVIEEMLSSAQLAASWCNTQPWQMIILSGTKVEAFRTGLYDHVVSGAEPDPDIEWPSYQGVYLDRRREVGWMLYDAVGIKKGDRAASQHQALRNFQFFDAPHVALVTSDRALGPYGLVDCGGFVQSFMLAVTAQGLGCIAQAAIAGYSGFVRRFLDIGEDRLILCGIAFGHADRDHPSNSFRAPRATVDAVADFRG